MRFLVVTIVLAGLSCVPTPRPIPTPATPTPNTDDDGDDDDAACEPLSSGDLLIAGVESDPNYDDDLAALDDAIAALPDALSLDGLAALQRDIVLYMLELDAFDPTSPSSISKSAALDAGPLGRAVVAAFAASGDASLDFVFLRRGLHRFYACDRGLPRTLADFNANIVDVASLEEGETVDSDVKGLPRRMRRSAFDGVFVAETLLVDDVTGDITVRETEILMTDRRRDGAIDFLEYDATGNLRSASSFATSTGGESVGSVPFTCMACHNTHDITPP